MLPPQDMEYRLTRKRFNDGIGMLSNTFGRMLEEPASRHFIKTELNSFITQSYLLAAHLTAVKVLLQRRMNAIDPELVTRLLASARKDVAAELGAAIRLLEQRASATLAESDSDEAPPPSACALAWSLESSLEHRLDSI